MTTPATDLVMIHESANWRWWTTQDFWDQHQADITPFLDYPDQYIPQIRLDFGYDVPQLAQKFDLVLDPDSQGGATGSVFGPYGITIAADSVQNVVSGIQGFWFYILSLHETVNVWTGHLATGWPWADGSSLWFGTSPFPSMVDIVVTRELGYTDVSDVQAQMMSRDTRVQLLLNLQKTFGWSIYQGMFDFLRTYGISSWLIYPEPLRTGVLILFLSGSAGRNLYSNFVAAGVPITNDAFTAAQDAFSDIHIGAAEIPWILVGSAAAIATGVYLYLKKKARINRRRK